MNQPTYLKLDEIQKELLSLLVFFDQFCNENGLRYSLACGTLLGAVRHKGFIPWDDDVDLSMPRPDYERFLALSNAMPFGYRTITNHNSPFPYPFAKFQNLNVRAQEPTYQGIMDGYLWLDIFPVDGIPESRLCQDRLQAEIWKLRRRRVWLSLPPPTGLRPKAVAIRMCRLFHSDPAAVGKLDARMAELASEVEYRDACYVASLYGGTKKAVALLREEYDRTIDLEFEGLRFPAPSCWDISLAQEYGDYMTLPPEEERVTHGMKAWYAIPSAERSRGVGDCESAGGRRCRL